MEVNVLVDTFVPSELIEELKEKLDKVQRRAKRVGFPMPELSLLEKVTGSPSGALQAPVEGAAPVEWRHITIQGEPLRLGDYRLIASIDPLEIKEGLDPEKTKRVAFFRPVPSQTVPAEWRETDPSICQHCNTYRYRAETFLVAKDLPNDVVEYKQVGRQCIRDFLGHDVGNLIPFLKVWDELEDWLSGDPDSGWGPRIEMKWTPQNILRIAAIVVAVDGFYISKKKAAESEYSDWPLFATSETVRDLLSPMNDKRTRELQAKYFQPEFEDKGKEIADAAIIGITEIASSPAKLENEWMYNVHLVFSASAITSRQVGVAASGVIMGVRRLEDRQRALEATDHPSEYVGQIGEKLSIKAEVTGSNTFETNFGWTTLLSFKDEQGNILKWFASNAPDLDIGAIVEVRGTVKAHEEWKGQRQTVLTRCKMKENK